MSTQSTDTDAPSRELTNLLRLNGASDAFINVILTDPEDANVSRNSCREEVLKWVRWNDGEITEDALEAPSFGGGFFEKVWHGEIGAAYGHADSNNQAILIEAFGINYLNSVRPADYPEVTA